MQRICRPANFYFVFLAVVVAAAAGRRKAKNGTIKLFTICQGQMQDRAMPRSKWQIFNLIK